MTNTINILTKAVDHHRAGRLEAAEALYRDVLRQQPNNPDALHLLGVIARQQGRAEVAVHSIEQALAVRPEDAAALNNLGLAHQALGHLDRALDRFEQAVAIRPEFAEAHNNRGIALREQDRLDEAVASYHHAIRLQPDYAQAHHNLGVALTAQHHLDEAVTHYRRAVAIKPDYAKAHNNLGIALKTLGLLDEAEASYRRALEIEPAFCEALHNLGNTLKEAQRLDEAIPCYERALRIRPRAIEVHRSLAAALCQQGHTAAAGNAYGRLAQLCPDQPLVELRRTTLYPAVFDDRKTMEQARDDLVRTVARFAATPLTADPVELCHFGCEPPFNLQFDAGDLRPIKEACAGMFRHSFPRFSSPKYTGQPRIGIVVTRGHEDVFLRSLRGILEHITPGQFDIVVLCHPAGRDVIGRTIRGPSVRVLAVEEPITHMAETIARCGFDVLYYREVGTDAINYFLPFFRLAPVQCTSFGIQVTSGISSMDYYLSSRLVEPTGAQDHYSERLLLAETLLPYRYRTRLPTDAKTREDFGLDSGRHLYVCAQQLGKFHPDFDSFLAGILRRDPQGTVVITKDRYGHGATRLRARFAKTLGDVADRVTMLPMLPRSDYLGLLAAADVLLDPPHFGGVNTTYDGFSFDRPIVTLPSRFHRGRFTLGCYRKMGMDECVAADEAHYVDIAVRLGTDADWRAWVSDRIHQTSEVLFEDIMTVREHERLFHTLVEAARSDSA